MSVSNDSTVLNSTIDNGGALLSSTFLEFCAKVRSNDPSILPEFGKPFTIHFLSERQYMELADALLENTSIKYLELEMVKYTTSVAEAMAKYVRTSKHLQHIRMRILSMIREEILCCFLLAIQESTSLKELHMEFPLIGGQSNLALENMLTHTQSLRSLTLSCPDGLLEDVAVAAARSGLKKNTTLRELTLDLMQGVGGERQGAPTFCSLFTSLRPSFPSKAMSAWARDGSDWTRHCVVK
jgi:hypothetical protein